MATKITQDQIIEMNRWYLIDKTYAAVARRIGVSAGTVKKYIITDFIDPAAIEVKKFNEELKEFDVDWIKEKTWKELLKLTEEEEKGIEELWKELTI